MLASWYHDHDSFLQICSCWWLRIAWSMIWGDMWSFSIVCTVYLCWQYLLMLYPDHKIWWVVCGCLSDSSSSLSSSWIRCQKPHDTSLDFSRYTVRFSSLESDSLVSVKDKQYSTSSESLPRHSGTDVTVWRARSHAMATNRIPAQTRQLKPWKQSWELLNVPLSCTLTNYIDTVAKQLFLIRLVRSNECNVHTCTSEWPMRGKRSKLFFFHAIPLKLTCLMQFHQG